ncbi:hypothetical protein SAMN06295960_0273 [Paenibacillus aquistagni]|uniref:Uncharacterized protein n=2 Tax=Paenibacillus aquistagni TaxID=1852522 RepID=A0A1X7IAD7_9BACL|nr:hypothetical protein SAMN06295960_0273 [Paenibacillus aquistagni]
MESFRQQYPSLLSRFLNRHCSLTNHLPDGTLIDENNKWNETTFAYFETYIKHEGMEAPLTHYDSWVKETYGRTKWEGFVKTSGEVTMGFTKGLLTGIIEGIVDTAGLAYQLVVDPQQVGQDMLYAAEYLIQNPDMVVEAAKQMYANFESASPEEKAEMIGKVSSILVPGMGVTKAGKAAKVPEALSSMTQAVKTSKAVNVLSDPLKKLKGIDWRTYANSFQDWTKGLQPGRYAVTPEGMFIRIPDETSSVVRRIDAGDGKKIEGMGKPPHRIFDENGNPLPFGFSSDKQYDDFVKSLKEELPEGTQILFQGSSVTGVSHKKGLPFDQDRKSDFDIALVNDDLFLEALEIGRGGGFKMKTDPNRIGPLDEKQLDRLGLLEIIEKKSKEAGRPVSFMLYESVEQALKRPSLTVTP